MSPEQFRSIALGLAGATEGSHMSHPDFRVKGRIFATIAPDEQRGMVRLTTEQQAEFVRRYPQSFEAAAGAWGRSGCTMVRFAGADAAIVTQAIELAFEARGVQTAKAASRTRRTRSTNKSSPKKGSAKKNRRAR
jgi:hypothetical protein